MKRMIRGFILFLTISSASFIFAQNVPAFAFIADPQAREEAAEREEELYRDGTEYLDEAKWQQAADKFAKVAEMKGPKADAAMYWRAYALNRAGRRQDAQAQIDELRKTYPQSGRLKDAAALELEMKQNTGRPVNPGDVHDEDLKIMALHSLMNSDDERALPMLQEVINNPKNSPRLKREALFVLAQSDDPKAQPIIQAIARGQANPDLQRKAIEMIGINGHRDSIATLVDIYNKSTDPSIKRSVLQAFLTSDAKENVLAVAKNEKDQSLRRAAIHQLGAMDARAELRQMLPNAQTIEDKKAIIEACAISGDSELLAQVAKTSPEPEVRNAAIHGLGISESKTSRATLLSMYPTEQAKDAKRAIVEALFMQEDARDLIALFKSESDPDMKKNIAEKLSVMDNKEARDFLIEFLNK
jgi:tetratricopeptide (TPR) repeat protein